VGVGQRVNCSPEGSTSPSSHCDTRPHAAHGLRSSTCGAVCHGGLRWTGVGRSRTSNRPLPRFRPQASRDVHHRHWFAPLAACVPGRHWTLLTHHREMVARRALCLRRRTHIPDRRAHAGSTRCWPSAPCVGQCIATGCRTGGTPCRGAATSGYPDRRSTGECSRSVHSATHADGDGSVSRSASPAVHATLAGQRVWPGGPQRRKSARYQPPHVSARSTSACSRMASSAVVTVNHRSPCDSRTCTT
jgi:hypothetical protein